MIMERVIKTMPYCDLVSCYIVIQAINDLRMILNVN